PGPWLIQRLTFGGQILLILLYTPCALVLWARPALPMGQLRWVEGVVYGMFVALCGADTLDIAGRNIPYSIPAGAVLPNGSIMPWFACILSYGFLVPNTARRCLPVVGLSALTGAASMIGSWLLYGAEPVQVFRWSSNVIIWLGMAIAITVSGVHWLDKYR